MKLTILSWEIAWKWNLEINKIVQDLHTESYVKIKILGQQI